MLQLARGRKTLHPETHTNQGDWAGQNYPHLRSNLSHYFLSYELWKKALRKISFLFLLIKLNPRACILDSHFSCVLPSVFFGCAGGIFYDKRTTSPVCMVWAWPSGVSPTGPLRKRARNSQGSITARAFSAFNYGFPGKSTSGHRRFNNAVTEQKLCEGAPAMPTWHFPRSAEQWNQKGSRETRWAMCELPRGPWKVLNKPQWKT